jgi:hypothetical protein
MGDVEADESDAIVNKNQGIMLPLCHILSSSVGTINRSGLFAIKLPDLNYLIADAMLTHHISVAHANLINSRLRWPTQQ